jgi:hypothetical protein
MSTLNEAADVKQGRKVEDPFEEGGGLAGIFAHIWLRPDDWRFESDPAQDCF